MTPASSVSSVDYPPVPLQFSLRNEAWGFCADGVCVGLCGAGGPRGVAADHCTKPTDKTHQAATQRGGGHRPSADRCVAAAASIVYLRLTGTALL